MYVLGHVGLTVAAVRAADREADLRLPALLSLLPDLVDKPVAVLLPGLVHESTRNFAHTLLAASAVLVLLLAARRRLGNPLLLWACYAGHLVLDRMWLTDGPVILLWPLLGPFPAWSPFRPPTPHLFAYNLTGEALGLTALLVLARRGALRRPPRASPCSSSGPRA
jgi:hypothetical protein